MMFMWIVRVFLFTLYESPKYLVGRGRDEEALHTIHSVAAYNRTTTSIKAEDLSVSHSSTHGTITFTEHSGHVRFLRGGLSSFSEERSNSHDRKGSSPGLSQQES